MPRGQFQERVPGTRGRRGLGELGRPGEGFTGVEMLDNQTRQPSHGWEEGRTRGAGPDGASGGHPADPAWSSRPTQAKCRRQV